jgi:multidrug efflux pump subunit AcrA (membrane-fusion protein)
VVLTITQHTEQDEMRDTIQVQPDYAEGQPWWREKDALPGLVELDGEEFIPPDEATNEQVADAADKLDQDAKRLQSEAQAMLQGAHLLRGYARRLSQIRQQ